ncbi:SapC family protein [Methylobacterium nigriterrae]|uniref:SapC family protein n=1 Tax=Methylobacterium nigriterrae TaxID=3127512 RepID=UPI003013F5A5
MSTIQPVSPARHAGLRWRGSASYRFAATTAVVPLAAAEVAKAALALPLAFIQRDDHWGLAAVLGLLPGQNLYVDGNGAWLARYVPAGFRGYPFLIGTQANGEPTLCVDEASGLVGEGTEGELFFDEAGALSPSVAQVATFLTETARSEAALMEACDLLVKAGVVEVWPITVQGEQGTQHVAGLYRVNETALNGLDDATYSALRRSGVIAVAYAQLLSTGNLTQLGQLAQARAQAEAAERAKAEVKPIITLPEESTIDWDWSKIGR